MADGLLEGRGVAEIQGLYGPFGFSEILLQEIWARGDFAATSARTTDGRVIRILDHGRWNRMGGPDFLDARIQIGDVVMDGDVELHLHASDWQSHGHQYDPLYERVILHVVLFQTQEQGTKGAHGLLPILVLLPLLNHALEEYATDNAIEHLADRHFSEAGEQFLSLRPAERDELILKHARQRWSEKVHYARQRVQRLGWDEACHHTALEILGYRFNRAPMLTVAAKYPLRAWSGGEPSLPEHAFGEQSARWKRQGVRPANDPRIRLRQYAQWTAGNPDWPGDLIKEGGRLPEANLKTLSEAGDMRRELKLGGVRAMFAEQIAMGSVGGPRLNTLICDGFLPLLAARDIGIDLFALWHVWPAGDIPAKFRQLLRAGGICGSRERPLCHGPFQGLLGRLIANDARSEAILRSSAGRGA
jgi:hypothetical protein